MPRRNSLFISICLLIILGAVWLIRPLSWFVSPELLVNRSGFSQAVYDRKGGLMYLSLSSDEKYRLWTPLTKISRSMIQATLRQEDAWFYYHPGVNPISMIRAILLTYFQGVRVGGSTITMQLARIRYGLRTRTVRGKLSQIGYALMLEALFTKDELLEAYLNLAPYGDNVEGVGAAARIYFGKSAKELSLGEAVTLSVIPQLPSKRLPYKIVSEQTDSLASARKRLLQRSSHEIKASPEQVFASGSREDLKRISPHLSQREISRRRFQSEINTTIDPSLQTRIERHIGQFVSRNNKIGISNATALLVDYRSMEVKGYVGSSNFFNRDIQGFVDGVQARRSPGSALKPFVYGLAMDKGLIHPGSILKDTAFERSSYNPENFERDFVGPISATDALIRSRNIPAVSLLESLGTDVFYQFLIDSEIKSLEPREFYGLSLVLGGVEVRMDELASLYAMLANGGVLKPLVFDAEDTAQQKKEKRLLSPESSRLVLEMLSENQRPSQLFDSTHRLGNLSIPWKTGTSFSFRDAWAAGVVGHYVLLVWVGNFDGKANPSFIGREAAGPLFFTIADSLSADENLIEDWRMRSPKVKKVKVCAVSGELPGPNCTRLRNSWFIPGVSPIHTCMVHRKIFIDKERGVRTCIDSPKKGEEKVIEFWPSDLMTLFEQSGLPRRPPPPLAPECQGVRTEGSAPLITSPDPHLVYLLHENYEKIPFKAVFDSDSASSYWFVDDSFMGQAAIGETLFWKAVPGNFLVRVVDDRGRSNEVNLEVHE